MDKLTTHNSFLLVLFLLFSSSFMIGQDAIQGVVTDENNQPIIGANIIVVGTTTGTRRRWEAVSRAHGADW